MQPRFSSFRHLCQRKMCVSVVNEHEEPWRVAKPRRRQLETVHISTLLRLELNTPPTPTPPAAREHRPVFPPRRINNLTITVTITDGSKNAPNGCERWRRHGVYTNDHLQLQFRWTNRPPPPSLLKVMRYQKTNTPKSLGYILDGTKWLWASLFKTNPTKILYVTSGASCLFLMVRQEVRLLYDLCQGLTQRLFQHSISTSCVQRTQGLSGKHPAILKISKTGRVILM